MSTGTREGRTIAGGGLRELHVVLPNDIDDPALPSGGNAYDRKLCRELSAAGRVVREHAVHGAWPDPGATERAELAAVLSGLPDGAAVLLDGLVASTVPDVLAPHADRLRLVVLVHLPLADTRERDALACASAIVTTSRWTRQRLLSLYRLPEDLVHVATPGAEPAPLSAGSGTDTALLCVAAVTVHKGHDVLVRALAEVADLSWTCECVGPLGREPEFVERLRGEVHDFGLDDRIRFVGPRTGAGLDAAYAGADLLVHPSRGETYGMVVTEALARGIPVLASEVYGLPEALGTARDGGAPDGGAPGVLVPPGEPAALAGALRRWLGDPPLRQRLREAARHRRATLTDWSLTARQVATVVDATAVIDPEGGRA